MEAAGGLLSSCYQGSIPVVSILDTREPCLFFERRLIGSVNIPASILLERLFLLSDKDLQLAIVTGPGAGDAMKQELATRGWTAVGPCLIDDETLWGQAAASGHIETGPLRVQRWLFRPCTLLAQEAGRVEHLLLASHLHQRSIELTAEHALQHHCTSKDDSKAVSSTQPATASAAGQPGPQGNSKQVQLRCLDIGCGSGRDLAWLGTQRSHFTVNSSGMLHPTTFSLEASCRSSSRSSSRSESFSSSDTTYQIQWHVSGVDSWPGSLDRAQQLFNAAGLTAESAALHCACINSLTGEVESGVSGAGAARVARELEKCHATQLAACLPPLVTPLPIWPTSHFDLLICVRFLERSFLANLPVLLRVGGILMYSHFLDMEGTRSFGRPTGMKHVLAPGELAEWFSQRGFEVLRDEWEVLPDGRELSLFMARKLSSDPVKVLYL